LLKFVGRSDELQSCSNVGRGAVATLAQAPLSSVQAHATVASGLEWPLANSVVCGDVVSTTVESTSPINSVSSKLWAAPDPSRRLNQGLDKPM
jgi:hypothetical protein